MVKFAVIPESSPGAQPPEVPSPTDSLDTRQRILQNLAARFKAEIRAEILAAGPGAWGPPDEWPDPDFRPWDMNDRRSASVRLLVGRARMQPDGWAWLVYVPKPKSEWKDGPIYNRDRSIYMVPARPEIHLHVPCIPATAREAYPTFRDAVRAKSRAVWAERFKCWPLEFLSSGLEQAAYCYAIDAYLGASSCVGEKRVGEILASPLVTERYIWGVFNADGVSAELAKLESNAAAHLGEEIRVTRYLEEYSRLLAKLARSNEASRHIPEWPESLSPNDVAEWHRKQEQPGSETRANWVLRTWKRLASSDPPETYGRGFLLEALFCLADRSIQERPPALGGMADLVRRDHVSVLSSATYHELREALALNKFTHADDTPWPAVELTMGGARGRALLRSPEADALLTTSDEAKWVERMWEQCAELSDLEADALDALSANWLYQARDVDSTVLGDVDRFLELRGLQPKLGGKGKRGGFGPEQRQEFLAAMSRVMNIWLDMAVVETYAHSANGKKRGAPKREAVQSRTFVVTDRMGQMHMDGRMDVSRFYYRTGRLFGFFLAGAGRQTALLSARALKYNPQTQRPEKRLTRYLSYLWKCRAAKPDGYSQTFGVRALVEAAGIEVDYKRPMRALERLEKALDTLKDDKVCAHWQYANGRDVEKLPKRGWMDEWLRWTAEIEPPETIRDHYAVENGGAIRALPPAASAAPAPPSERMKTHRQALRLSQAQAAEALGISQMQYSRLERGARKPTPGLAKRIEAWMAGL